MLHALTMHATGSLVALAVRFSDQMHPTPMAGFFLPFIWLVVINQQVAVFSGAHLVVPLWGHHICAYRGHIDSSRALGVVPLTNMRGSSCE